MYVTEPTIEFGRWSPFPHFV